MSLSFVKEMLSDNFILFYPITLERRRGTTDEIATIPFHFVLFSAALVELAKSIPVHSLILSSHLSELQIIFTMVSVVTKENFNPFSNLISPFSIGTHENQWLFSIFLTHNWSPIYLLL